MSQVPPHFVYSLIPLAKTKSDCFVWHYDCELSGAWEKWSLLTGTVGLEASVGISFSKWGVGEIKICILYTKYYPKRCNGGSWCWLFCSRLARNWCKGPGVLKEFRVLALVKFCLSKVWTKGATSCDPICQGKLHSSMNNFISNNKLSWNIKAEGYFLCRYMANSCQDRIEDSWLQCSLDQVWGPVAWLSFIQSYC